MDWKTCEDGDEKLRLFAAAGGFGLDIDVYTAHREPIWLIHFTDQDARIAKDGFRLGLPIAKVNMAYSSGSRQTGPGYNFAFAADDDFSISTLVEYDFGGQQTAAVLFQAPGVAMTHYDGFDQVCFHGASVIFPMIRLRAQIDEDTADDEPHARPWSILDEEGMAGESFDDLFAAMTEAISRWEGNQGVSGPDLPTAGG